MVPVEYKWLSDLRIEVPHAQDGAASPPLTTSGLSILVSGLAANSSSAVAASAVAIASSETGLVLASATAADASATVAGTGVIFSRASDRQQPPTYLDVVESIHFFDLDDRVNACV